MVTALGAVEWNDYTFYLKADDDGLVGIDFDAGGQNELAVAQLLGVDSNGQSAAIIEQAVEQLTEYFTGKRTTFSLPLNPIFGTPFQKCIWQVLPEIPFGDTKSYQEVALLAGRSAGSARLIGTACAKNTLPIIVPCHRVLPASGVAGNYRGGTKMKQALLDFERELSPSN